MSEGVAFLRAILDNPDDDGVRLVYADWLEEHGQPERAEFIRVQIALASLPLGDRKRERLTARESELWREYGKGWEAELPEPKWWRWGRWRRGRRS